MWLPDINKATLDTPDAHISAAGNGAPDANVKCRLWLWLHPSAYSEVLEVLQEVYELKAQDCQLSQTRSEYGHEQMLYDPENIDEGEKNMDCQTREEIRSNENQENNESGNTEYSGIFFSTDEDVNEEKISDNENVEEETLEEREIKIKSRVLRKYQFLSERLQRHNLPNYTSDATGVSLICLKDTLNR